MKTESCVTHADNDREFWKATVAIDEHVVEVDMNTDTVVCSLEGYPFKTFSTNGLTGMITADATIVAIKYMAGLQSIEAGIEIKENN